MSHNPFFGVFSIFRIRSYFKNALKCDPISAFGGVVAVNSIVSKKLAIELNKIFFEVIVSRGFEKDALIILKKRKNIRLIDSSKFISTNNMHYLFLDNSFLAQDQNKKFIDKKLQIVTKITVNLFGNRISTFQITLDL